MTKQLFDGVETRARQFPLQRFAHNLKVSARSPSTSPDSADIADETSAVSSAQSFAQNSVESAAQTASDSPTPNHSPNHSPNSERDAHDNALVERCRGGDLGAFDEIVSRHQNAIYTLCFYHLRDADDAADAAQTAFVRAWRGLKNFRGESALKTWIHRIALNVIHDVGAKRGKTPVPVSSLITKNEDDETSFPEAVDTSPLPEAQLQSQARRQKVREALGELSPQHRDVLVLFDVQGHSYEEVAAVLEVPMGTVKSRLSRARLALREQLESCRELFED